MTSSFNVLAAILFYTAAGFLIMTKPLTCFQKMQNICLNIKAERLEEEYSHVPFGTAQLPARAEVKHVMAHPVDPVSRFQLPAFSDHKVFFYYIAYENKVSDLHFSPLWHGMELNHPDSLVTFKELPAPRHPGRPCLYSCPAQLFPFSCRKCN